MVAGRSVTTVVAMVVVMVVTTVVAMVVVVTAAEVIGAVPAVARPIAAKQHGPVHRPTVTGPITTGKGVPNQVTTSFDLATVGYERAEYFLSGTATAYASSKPLTTDGKWTVEPEAEAPYETRVVVVRPIDPAEFNGTVYVEWFNVSAGFETSPDWNLAHNQIIRSGAAWVGVSAQARGISGGDRAVGGGPGGGLKAADPERYGPLHHPGDSYSYDIFSQAGRAVRGTKVTDPLGGLDAQRVIALGESQSAFRMVTYINAVQPVAGVFDGFLVHSRASDAAPLLESPLPGIGVPDATAIRDDLDVPVLSFETETDTRFGHFPAPQDDTDQFRLWQVAGTAHADSYTAGIGFADAGDGRAEVQLLDVANADGGPLGCTDPINAGPQYAVLSSAVSHLEAWVRDGTAPPRAPRFELAPGLPTTIKRDSHGNALGGIRTPLVDAPNATLRGDGNAGGDFCQVFGRTVPLDAATLASLYPSHAEYVNKFDASADRAVKAGYLLAPEAKRLKAAAAQSSIGTSG